MDTTDITDTLYFFSPACRRARDTTDTRVTTDTGDTLFLEVTFQLAFEHLTARRIYVEMAIITPIWMRFVWKVGKGL
jgi:hypothetical protein